MAQFYISGFHVFLPAIIVLIALVCGNNALNCYQCGQYTDGVGSITPCLNFTEKHLKQCPKANQQHCIKYVTEGSIVRECAAECIEKRESWGTKVFCCSEDGCNLSIKVTTTPTLVAVATVFTTLLGQVFIFDNFY
ncbi:uncharacterized protein [Rhodnius prolixus]|uniref:uncharacterized protein n=1 Tax=Rhodnius prolixus TaxID=13249 RepID=UPI003D18B411